LDEIRELEAPIRNGASGRDIENLLIAISESTRAKPEKLEGVRYFFEGCLDNEQRTRVYEVIARLAEWPVGAVELCSQAGIEKTRSLMRG
jgi:hypothetical protein